jgi:hypothetical protein
LRALQDVWVANPANRVPDEIKNKVTVEHPLVQSWVDRQVAAPRFTSESSGYKMRSKRGPRLVEAATLPAAATEVLQRGARARARAHGRSRARARQTCLTLLARWCTASPSRRAWVRPRPRSKPT